MNWSVFSKRAFGFQGPHQRRDKDSTVKKNNPCKQARASYNQPRKRLSRSTPQVQTANGAPSTDPDRGAIGRRGVRRPETSHSTTIGPKTDRTLLPGELGRSRWGFNARSTGITETLMRHSSSDSPSWFPRGSSRESRPRPPLWECLGPSLSFFLLQG